MNFRQCHGVSLLPANFRGNLEIFKHSLKCGAEKVLFILGEAWILRGNWIFLLIKLLLHTTNYCNCNSPQSVKNVFVLIKKVKCNRFFQIIICFKWSLPVTLVLTKQSVLPLDRNFLILLILSGLVKSVKIIMLNKWVFICHQKFTIVTSETSALKINIGWYW